MYTSGKVYANLQIREIVRPCRKWRHPILRASFRHLLLSAARQIAKHTRSAIFFAVFFAKARGLGVLSPKLW
jgi:hypothetical protein